MSALRSALVASRSAGCVRSRVRVRRSPWCSRVWSGVFSFGGSLAAARWAAALCSSSFVSAPFGSVFAAVVGRPGLWSLSLGFRGRWWSLRCRVRGSVVRLLVSRW